MGRIHVRPQDRRFTYSAASRADAAVPAGAVGVQNVRGVSWTDFATGNYSPGDEQGMFVCLARLDAGMVDPLHHFDQPYLLCVLSGRMTMGGVDAGDGVELPAGSIVYLDAGEDFWFRASQEAAVEFMVAHPHAARYTDSRRAD